MPFRVKPEPMRMDYDIQLYSDNTYTLDFSFTVEGRVMKAAIEGLAKQHKFMFRESVEEEYNKIKHLTVDPRTYGFIANRLRKFVKRVEKEVRKDIKDFKIVSGRIMYITFERLGDGEGDGDAWLARINMSGEYVT